MSILAMVKNIDNLNDSVDTKLESATKMLEGRVAWPSCSPLTKIGFITGW